MKIFSSRFAIVLSLVLSSSTVHAFSPVDIFTNPFIADALDNGQVPQLPNNLHCLDPNRQTMAYNNQTVIKWKSSTPSQYRNRGFVQGTIATIYPQKMNSKGFTHTHFSANIDQIPGGDIELIFNDEFGPLPRLAVGMSVVACGDYITANSDSSLPSPMGAIIHWVHYNPGDRDGGIHADGFVIVNNAPYGFTTPPGSNRPYQRSAFGE